MTSASLPKDDRPARPSGEAGFVLIAVLWMLAALATLASIYSAYAINTAVSARAFDDRLQAEASIRAGIEMLALQQLALPKESRPSRGGFDLRIGRTRVAVSFRSEAARVDLNAAPPPLVAGLFRALGVAPDEAKTLADRVTGWRKKAEDNTDSKEVQFYADNHVPFPPRGAPFESTLELSLLPGLPPPIVGRILPYVTVFSGDAGVDVTAADPLVLSALPGMTPDSLDNVLKARAQGTADAHALVGLMSDASSSATAKPSDSIRASVEVDFKNGGRVQAEVVLRLKERGDEPYVLLYWRDDFDGPLPLG